MVYFIYKVILAVTKTSEIPRRKAIYLHHRKKVEVLHLLSDLLSKLAAVVFGFVVWNNMFIQNSVLKRTLCETNKQPTSRI